MDNITKDAATRSDLESLMRLSEAECTQTTIQWVMRKNARRQALATTIMANRGKTGVSLLAREIMAPRRSAQQCLRLLDALEKIGQPLELGDWFNLYRVNSHLRPEVGARTLHVMMLLQPVS
jgi:hypothetical protein